MNSEKLQVHLASKIEVPATEKVVDGKTIKTPARTIVVHGMSNRVVKFRVLDPDEVNAIALEAATLAGENATGRDVFIKQRMLSVHAMVVAVSVPTDKPLELKDKDWTKVYAADFLVPNGPKSWKSFFTTKDTSFLQAEYAKWHDMPVELFEMLSGKVLPLASED